MVRDAAVIVTARWDAGRLQHLFFFRPRGHRTDFEFGSLCDKAAACVTQDDSRTERWDWRTPTGSFYRNVVIGRRCMYVCRSWVWNAIDVHEVVNLSKRLRWWK
jgi:hypothetical protein